MLTAAPTGQHPVVTAGGHVLVQDPDNLDTAGRAFLADVPLTLTSRGG